MFQPTLKNEDMKAPNIWLAEEWRLAIASFVEDEDCIFKTVEESEDHAVCREPLVFSASYIILAFVHLISVAEPGIVTYNHDLFKIV